MGVEVEIRDWDLTLSEVGGIMREMGQREICSYLNWMNTN